MIELNRPISLQLTHALIGSLSVALKAAVQIPFLAHLKLDGLLSVAICNRESHIWYLVDRPPAHSQGPDVGEPAHPPSFLTAAGAVVNMVLPNGSQPGADITGCDSSPRPAFTAGWTRIGDVQVHPRA